MVKTEVLCAFVLMDILKGRTEGEMIKGILHSWGVISWWEAVFDLVFYDSVPQVAFNYYSFFFFQFPKNRS